MQILENLSVDKIGKKVILYNWVNKNVLAETQVKRFSVHRVFNTYTLFANAQSNFEFLKEIWQKYQADNFDYNIQFLYRTAESRIDSSTNGCGNLSCMVRDDSQKLNIITKDDVCRIRVLVGENVLGPTYQNLLVFKPDVMTNKFQNNEIANLFIDSFDHLNILIEIKNILKSAIQKNILDQEMLKYAIQRIEKYYNPMTTRDEEI